MKKFMISLLFAVSAMIANSAFAGGPALIICGDYAVGWGENCKNPNARRYDPNINYNNGYNGYNGGGSVNIWNRSSEYGSSQYGGRPYPAGGYNNGLVIVGYEEGTRPCTPQEEASRRHGYAVFGGVLGAGYGARENGNEAGRLGLIGAAAGELIGIGQTVISGCTVPTRRPIYASRGSNNMQQASYRERSQAVNEPATCVVHNEELEGVEFVVKNKAHCKAIAKRFSETKTVSATEKVSANNTETKTNATGETSSSSANKSLCPNGKIRVRMVEDIEPLKIKKGDEKCVSSQYKDDKRHVVLE